MSSNLKIFLTGATGYIGGAVLTRLLAHEKRDTFDITILVRSAEKAKIFEQKFDVKAAVGSQDDEELLKRLASEADVVFSIVDADALEAAKTTLLGIKQRYEKTGKQGILIHTSGTGVLADKAAGLYTGDIIYSDLNVKQIESIDIKAPHRDVDVVIVAGDEAGYVKTYIILPSTIYGLAGGPLVEAGLQNPHSIQVPSLIKASLGRGRAGVVGEGKNLWPNVHIDEVADLYIVLFDTILADPTKAGHGREGFYFGESGEHSLLDVGKAIGEALVALGKSDNPEPTSFTEEEIQKYFKGSKYLGSNSRARAERSRALGWKPVKTTKDLLASVKPETEAILKA